MAIEKILDFITQLQKISKSNNYEYYYRGHSDKDFELKPSIYRRRFIRNEDRFFKEIILRTPNDFINEKTALEKLVKMQHYGIPTRILDITTNPLVALYFACNELADKADGEVLVFKIPKTDIKFYDSDTVSILANISKRPYDFEIDSLEKSTTKAFNNEVPIQYLLHEIREEKPQFLPVIYHQDFARVVAVKVKLNNNRILKQNGAFLIFGINGSKKDPATIPSDWILNLEVNGINLKTDKKCKRQLLDDLDALGINESTLFPEIENQAKYLRRQFSKFETTHHRRTKMPTANG
ncbi:MAG: FRG domain-containing protein [Bacteroidales bacterium]|nr:FRG domain-containing protein [Bacteroidales bacterium]